VERGAVVEAVSRSSSRSGALADSVAAVADWAEVGVVAVEAVGSADSVVGADSEAEVVARAGDEGRGELRKRNRRDHASVKKDWEYDETR
jgi:hypothetical protein